MLKKIQKIRPFKIRMQKLSKRKSALKRIRESNYNIDTIDKYFQDHYNVSYKEIIKKLNEPLLKRKYKGYTLDKYILDMTKNPNHLILFPVYGSLFNYYFAKGMIQALKEKGLDNGLEARTITINSKAINNDEKFNDAKDAANVFYQIYRIFSKGKYNSYSIVDKILNIRKSRTRTQIEKALKAFNINVPQHKDYISKEHQIISVNNSIAFPKRLGTKDPKKKGYLPLPYKKSKYLKNIIETRKNIKEALFYAGKIHMESLISGSKKKQTI